MDGRVWEAMHVAHALARSHEFDLVHSHLGWLPLAFAQHCRAPLLTTVHGFSGPGILPGYARAASRYVSISDADRSYRPGTRSPRERAQVQLLLSGAIDLSVRVDLRRVLRAAVAGSPGVIDVDLGEVAFPGRTGMGS